jgi:hypothetical protein
MKAGGFLCGGKVKDFERLDISYVRTQSTLLDIVVVCTTLSSISLLLPFKSGSRMCRGWSYGNFAGQRKINLVTVQQVCCLRASVGRSSEPSLDMSFLTIESL